MRHAFFTRAGGVSDGVYASLNCGFGSDDRRERVQENRDRALGAFGRAAERLVTSYQVHGTTVLPVEGPWPPGKAPVADAMVSTTPGIVLGVLAADCAPVLLADERAGVIASAHAGWRGAL
ncbi:MAG: polyphenol oxidase family protein, partial [Alphaproteobacteria bacterium]